MKGPSSFQQSLCHVLLLAWAGSSAFAQHPQLVQQEARSLTPPTQTIQPVRKAPEQETVVDASLAPDAMRNKWLECEKSAQDLQGQVDALQTPQNFGKQPHWEHDRQADEKHGVSLTELLAIGGQGFLRGVSDLRTPLVIIIVGNVVNLILELVLVYGFDLGIEASAWGTVVAQTGMGIAVAVVIRRRAGLDHPHHPQTTFNLLYGNHLYLAEVVRRCGWCGWSSAPFPGFGAVSRSSTPSASDVRPA